MGVNLWPCKTARQRMVASFSPRSLVDGYLHLHPECLPEC